MAPRRGHGSWSSRGGSGGRGGPALVLAFRQRETRREVLDELQVLIALDERVDSTCEQPVLRVRVVALDPLHTLDAEFLVRLGGLLAILLHLPPVPVFAEAVFMSGLLAEKEKGPRTRKPRRFCPLHQPVPRWGLKQIEYLGSGQPPLRGFQAKAGSIGDSVATCLEQEVGHLIVAILNRVMENRADRIDHESIQPRPVQQRPVLVSCAVGVRGGLEQKHGPKAGPKAREFTFTFTFTLNCHTAHNHRPRGDLPLTHTFTPRSAE